MQQASEQKTSFGNAATRQKVDLKDGLRLVEKEYGVPLAVQVREIFTLSRNHIKLNAWEYFYYGLFRQDMPMEEKKRFVGDEMQRAIFIACNRMAAWQLAADKLCFYIRLRAEGFRVPECYAQIQRQRSSYTCEHFSDKEAFRAWFFNAMPTPAFCKPVDSSSGDGAYLVSAVDKATGEFTDGKGRAYPFDALWELAAGYMEKGGFVIQEALRVHPAIAPQSHGQLATVRVVVILKDTGPEILTTAWRCPSEEHVVDNFSFLGNFYTQVDKETGEVRRVKRSAAIPQPVTDSPLLGFCLPLWQELRQEVLRAALLFPDIRLQSWDVAITDQGVMFIEMNPGGSIGNCQVVTETGAWQGDLIPFVQESYRKDMNTTMAFPRKTVERMLFGR